MYNIKKKNTKIYKIYKKIKSDRKKNFLLCTSYGIDSNSTTKVIKKLVKKNLIILININHKTLIEKKISIKSKNILKSKLKIKNKNQSEKNLRTKRFKKIKNICNKKLINIWIFQQKDEILENFLIQKLIKNKNLKKIKEYKKKYIINKIKPINKIKKYNIKYIEIKKNRKWIEEKGNIKYKNIRNKLRINIINNIKVYVKILKNLSKNML